MLKLENITKKYGEREILHDINLTFEKGEITFLVGSSGAGKTTLLNIIGGLSKATSGDIYLDNVSINDDLCGYRAENLGFVFQDFNLISGLSIAQNISIATAFSGHTKDIEIIKNKIKSLGLSNPDQRVESLSGGEKQRTAVIRSICKDANVIIADEPTGNLDSKNADLVFGLLQSLKADKHIIIVSHDIEKAKKFADRIITLKDGMIISDEKISTAVDSSHMSLEKKNTQNKRASSMPLHALWTLGKNSVRIRKGKIFSIAFIIALAISSIATLIGLRQVGNNLSYNVNVNYLENDLISIFHNFTPNSGYKELPLSTNEIEELKSDYSNKESTLIYCNIDESWLFSHGNKTAKPCVKQINIDSFFEERIMTNDIEGEFLKSKNDIILAKDVAEKLFTGDCIGQEVVLNDDSGNSVTLKIIGVNSTQNPFDTIYSFISADLMKDMLENKLKSNLYQRQEVNFYYEDVQDVTGGCMYGGMQSINGNEKIILGKTAQNYDEIMISTELFSNIIGSFNMNKTYTNEQIIAGKLSTEDIAKITSQDFAINYNGVWKVRIIGVYESSVIEIRYTDELIKQLKEADPIIMDLYLSDTKQISNTKNAVNSTTFLKAETQLETLKENVSTQTRFFSFTLIVLGVILVLISFSLLKSFSRISVMERTKEVAIIKSLGATNNNVLKILLFDTVIIAILSFTLSMIFSFLFYVASPKIFADINVLYFNFPFLRIVLINIIFMAFVFLQTSLSLNKIVKKMPAELFAT